jgi:hypothetical protein
MILPYSRPLPQLRVLEVQHFTFPAAPQQPESAHTATAAPGNSSRPLDHLLLSCQHLTQLQLVSCRLLPSNLQSLTLLTNLHNLQHLQLSVASGSLSATFHPDSQLETYQPDTVSALMTH